MKTWKHYRPLTLVLAGSLLLARASLAQVTPSNTEPVEAEAATTNASTSGPEAAQTNAGPIISADRAWAKASHAHSPGRPGELVVYGHDVEVKSGQTVDSVVVFGGSATVHGKVRADVVVFGGDTQVDGEVDGAVVTFLGGLTLQTNGVVKGDAVSFLGGVTVQTNATVQGDAVAFGGSVDVAEGGAVKGDIVPFGFGAGKWGLPRWFQQWLVHCVLKLRPLALQVGWVWAVAGVFFFFYLLIAVVVPRPVQACVNELTQRPATTFLLGLATLVLTPLLFLLLAVTGIGLVVVPFIAVALFFGAAVGKVAFLEWLGLRIGQRFATPALQKPVVAFLLGTLLLTLLYLVWVVGLLAFLLFSIWGLGVAVTAAFGGLRREAPQRPPPHKPSPEPVMAAAPGFPSPAVSAPETARASQPGPGTATLEPPVQPLPQELTSYPNAGLGERLGAAFLDVVLVGLVTGFIHVPLAFIPRIIGGPPFAFLVALAYFAGMWTSKGTTVGGIVFGLKVVRLDGRPITFSVALVRALAAAFSVVVLFLGFLWMLWDREKQTWHDILAGTVVLRLPRGTPLV